MRRRERCPQRSTKPSPLGKVANNRLFATDCLTDEVAVQGKYPLAFRRIRTAITSSDLTWQSLRSATFPKGEGQVDRVMNAQCIMQNA